MTFNLMLIAIFAGGGYVYSLMMPKLWRKWALFIASVLAVYALQPPLLVRHIDFVLPTTTILVATLVWALTIPRTDTTFRMSQTDLFTLLLLMVIITGLALMRLLPPEWRVLTASRPPEPLTVFLVITPITVLIWLIGKGTTSKNQHLMLSITILFIVIAFIILKTEPLAVAVSGWLREAEGRDPSLAHPLTDLNWIGFSYVALADET